MKYIYSTGNNTVDSLRGINITGNIIPQNWYKTICNEKGKPDLNAIVILADILYWYRPSVIRDEQTGEEIGLSKKFKDNNYLQKSYKQIENQFGMSKRSARNAIVHLEELGLIKRIFKNIVLNNGSAINNVMYVDLKVQELLEITFPNVYPVEARTHKKTQKINNFNMTNKSDRTIQIERVNSHISKDLPYKISDTNTKSTTKSTTNNTEIVLDEEDTTKQNRKRLKDKLSYLNEIALKNQDIKTIYEYLIRSNVNIEQALDISFDINHKKIDIPMKVIKQQIDYCIQVQEKEGIYNFKEYFVNGLEKRMLSNNIQLYKLEKQSVEVPLYNWVEGTTVK